MHFHVSWSQEASLLTGAMRNPRRLYSAWYTLSQEACWLQAANSGWLSVSTTGPTAGSPLQGSRVSLFLPVCDTSSSSDHVLFISQGFFQVQYVSSSPITHLTDDTEPMLICCTSKPCTQLKNLSTWSPLALLPNSTSTDGLERVLKSQQLDPCLQMESRVVIRVSETLRL